MKTNARNLKYLGAALAAVGGLMLSNTAQAQIWDGSYAGDQLASSPWSLGNAGNVTTGTGTITFGVSGASTYAQQLHSTGGSTWAPTGTGTYEATFSISAYGTGAQAGGVLIATGSQRVPIYFSASGFDLAGYTGTGDDLSLNTTYKMRIEYTPTLVSIFLNDAPVSGLQNKTGTYVADTINLTYVQRFAGTVGNDSVVTYSNVQWNNTSIVPEPATAGLMGLGLLVVLLKARRKHLAQG